MASIAGEMISSAPIVRATVLQNMTWLEKIWRWVQNILNRLLHGKTEFQVICEEEDEVLRMVRLKTYLALSEHLMASCKMLFAFEAFDVENAVESVMVHEGFSPPAHIIMTSNLRRSMIRFNYVNRVYKELCARRDEAYDSTKAKHEEQLEALWSALKPGIRRTGGRITKEWSEIGFQGTDPMTDFRGMGVLSLDQLVFFATKFPVEAKLALDESNHPKRWYPFATTGINITGFVMDLMRDRLLDHRLYQLADASSIAIGEAQGLEQGMEAFHRFYCDVFSRFNATWVAANPVDLMEFPKIFQSVKQTIRQQLLDQAYLYSNPLY